MSSTAPGPSSAPERRAAPPVPPDRDSDQGPDDVRSAGGLVVSGLIKDYPTPTGLLRVLDGVDLTLAPGESAAVMGASGCGKSTLLFLLGAIEAPTAGEVRLGGVDPHELAADAQAQFRRDRVGFVFQDHCLLPQCTALENVLTPTLPDPHPDDAARAASLLDRVGLSDRGNHHPSELSGGEKQRVAIARSLIRRPRLLLCDEPTGNLDGAAAEKVASLLLDAAALERGRIVVLVTHDRALASRFPARFTMRGGRLR